MAPLDWFDLVHLSNDELARHDVVAVQLATVAGLPGAEVIDHDRCMSRVAEMTELTGRYIRASRPHYLPYMAKYGHSEAYRTAISLITALQRHCGVHYDEAMKPAEAVFGPMQISVAGIVQGDGGTCASMPVLYASVGRRLGLPVNLVSCYPHVFARWEGEDGERFNMEATDRGLAVPPDDHFREGQFAPTRLLEGYGHYMVTKTPRHELATFLRERALQWRQAECYREEVECLAWSAEVYPCELMDRRLNDGLVEWWAKLDALRPPKMPRVDMKVTGRRFQARDARFERGIIGGSVMEDLLSDPEHQGWWAPQRAGGEPPPEMPKVIRVVIGEPMNFANLYPRKGVLRGV